MAAYAAWRFQGGIPLKAAAAAVEGDTEGDDDTDDDAAVFGEGDAEADTGRSAAGAAGWERSNPVPRGVAALPLKPRRLRRCFSAACSCAFPSRDGGAAGTQRATGCWLSDGCR